MSRQRLDKQQADAEKKLGRATQVSNQLQHGEELPRMQNLLLINMKAYKGQYFNAFVDHRRHVRLSHLGELDEAVFGGSHKLRPNITALNLVHANVQIA